MRLRSLPVTVTLAVGEGRAETTLLRHLRNVLLPQDCGIVLQVKEGFAGKSAEVVDYAIRVRKPEHDRCLVLLSVGPDLDENVRARAELSDVELIEADPCLEHWLLRIVGEQGAHTKQECEREFELRFGSTARDPSLYARHFDAELLRSARGYVSQVHTIFKALGL